MVEFPLSDKVFPVVVCLHKLSFSFLTLSSMLPLSSEIASKVFFPFSSIKLLWMALPSDVWCQELLCVCFCGMQLVFSVLLYFEISTFCLALLLTQHNGLCQNTCEGIRLQTNARSCAHTHTQSTLGNCPLGGFWITMFSMLSAAWHH